MFVILLKDKIRKLFTFFGLDFTQNLKYDRLTHLIIKKTMANGGVGVDVGCHKGEILDEIIKYSPKEKHYGFEPIPYLYDKLVKKYGVKNYILPFALSDDTGETTFHHVKNAPAYSGLEQRKYDIPNPDIQQIKVEVRRLDDIVDSDSRVTLIKIDVEGGEMGVLKGAKQTIIRSRPVILFEFGLGASDVYGTSPQEVHEFFTSLNYKIYLLHDYLNQKHGLTLALLEKAYNKDGEFYYVAESM
ncbi:MAG: FkbM family methyltransferase [Saprospiraceae bacterium]|nr:FkbM family methyltransferase [Saprospiraceae bacterium]